MKELAKSRFVTACHDLTLVLVASLIAPESEPTIETPADGTQEAITTTKPADDPLQATKTKGVAPRDASNASDRRMLEKEGCAADIDQLTEDFLDRRNAIEQRLEQLKDILAARTRERHELTRDLDEADKDSKLELRRRVASLDGAIEEANTEQGQLSADLKEIQGLIDDRYPNIRGLKRCVRRRKNDRIEEMIDKETQQEKSDRIEAMINKETRSFRGVMKDARVGRCSTAICWGPSNKWAFEPLAELPIGKSFSFNRSGLGRYINGNEIQVSFSAGLRFWALWDWFSLSVYLSKPILNPAETITIRNSNHGFSASQVRRPFPGLGVGLFGDIIWLSADYDRLINGNGGSERAPEFRPNGVVSRAVTFTIAIAPIAGIRNGLGTLSQKREREKEAEKREALEKQLAAATKRAEEADKRAEEADARAAAVEKKPPPPDPTTPPGEVIVGPNPVVDPALSTGSPD